MSPEVGGRGGARRLSDPVPPPPSCRGRHGGELGQGRAAAGGVSAAGGLNGSASLSRRFYLCGRGREKLGEGCLSPPGTSGVLQGAIHSRAGRETWSLAGCSARGSSSLLAALARRVLVFWGSGGWQGLVAVSWSGGGCAGGAAGWESCREPPLPARPGDALPGFHTCRRLGELQRFNGENGDLAGAGSLPPLSIFS